ncbi:MAG: hypothetical protein N2170_07740 [Bacteroidia bacterium]|nr:hypothetical protein [Bacteroidia bacterium]
MDSLHKHGRYKEAAYLYDSLLRHPSLKEEDRRRTYVSGAECLLSLYRFSEAEQWLIQAEKLALQ